MPGYGEKWKQLNEAGGEAGLEQLASDYRPLPKPTQEAFAASTPNAQGIGALAGYNAKSSGQFDDALNSLDVNDTSHPVVQSLLDQVKAGKMSGAKAGQMARAHMNRINPTAAPDEHDAYGNSTGKASDRAGQGPLVNRDAPGLELGLKARQVQNQARDRSGEIAARNQGALDVANTRADASRDVADMQTRQRRDSSVIGATASMYRTDAMLKKAIEDNKSREKVATARGQKVPDHVGQQLKGLQLQLEGAGKELASATQEYNSITTLAATKGDSGQLAEAHKRVEAAQAKVAGIEAATQQFLSSGNAGTSDGGQPFKVRMPAGSTDLPPEAQGKTILDGGIQEPPAPDNVGPPQQLGGPGKGNPGPPPGYTGGVNKQGQQLYGPTGAATNPRPAPAAPAPAPAPAPNPPPQQVGTVVITGAPGTKNAGRQKTISIADVSRWTGRGEYIVVAPQR